MCSPLCIPKHTIRHESRCCYLERKRERERESVCRDHVVFLPGLLVLVRGSIFLGGGVRHKDLMREKEWT